MDKRLINFMLLSMLIILSYNMIFNPPKPPAVEAEPNGVNGLVEEPFEGDDNAQVVLAEVDPAEAIEASAEEATPPAELRRFTIGSVDPDSPYRMLVTFISQGAAVERIELSDPRYRDLVDKSAYIGHLALDSAPQMQGARVNVVGGGTPASKAQPFSRGVDLGLRVGDVITKIGEEPVSSPAEFHRLRQTYKAGDIVDLTVDRIDDSGAKRSLNFTLQSVRRPMEMVRPEPIDPDDENPRHPLSYLLSLEQVGPRRTQFDQVEFPTLPSMRNGNWYSDVTEADGVTKVEFRFPLGRAELKTIGIDGAVEIVKRFWLPVAPEENRDYHFDFEVELINRGQHPIEIGYRLDGPTGLPLEGWWYSFKTHPTSWGGAGVRDVVLRKQGGDHQMITNPKITKQAEKDPHNPKFSIVETDERLVYVGMDAKYFNSTLLAAPTATAESAAFLVRKIYASPVAKIDELRKTRTDITFHLENSVDPIAAGKSFTQHFQIFAGPKKPSVLAAYGLDECIVYGWFKWPALLMGQLLHFLHGIVGNYGIAIILLTVVVRACMFPIGRQQAMNARKMQELTPEIKKIKEKYPDDMQKQTAAQQELFRKHKYNPVAGCLPMFLQLPIFIGLYRALSVDIELRQTPLIPGIDWCSNLASPDMLWRWDSVFSIQMLTGYTGWLGPYFNILPLISVGLFLVHQQLFTPPPTDEQQVMQQKVMKFMTLFIGVLFFKVPAGLCLYFITSSLWALAERKMLPKAKTETEQTPISLAASNTGPTATKIAKTKRATSGINSNGAGDAPGKKSRRRKKNRR